MAIQSPKARFRKTDMAKKILQVTFDPDFVASTDVAMLQMQYELGTAATMNDAVARHYMMEGARRYVSILLSLATPETKLPPMKGDNLPNPDA